MTRKFYPHDVQLARQRRNKRQQEASKKHPSKTRKWFAEYNLLQLQEIVDNGLDDVYGSFEDFLFDFFTDFSWDAGASEEAQLMLADPRFSSIASKIKEDWGTDIKDELEKLQHEDRGVEAMVDRIAAGAAWPEAMARVKEIITLLQSKHLCASKPFVDGQAKGYRIKCFQLTGPFSENLTEEQVQADISK
ncbi:MAG: hypothetical protein WC895_04370, partial [Candidatus Shapirobacteria bacterium]